MDLGGRWLLDLFVTCPSIVTFRKPIFYPFHCFLFVLWRMSGPTHFLGCQALALPLTALLKEGKVSQVLSLLLARQASSLACLFNLESECLDPGLTVAKATGPILTFQLQYPS